MFTLTINLSADLNLKYEYNCVVKYKFYLSFAGMRLGFGKNSGKF